MFISKENINYYVRKPDKNRRTYSLTKYNLVSRSQKIYLPLSESEQELINIINELFVSKQITSVEAEVRLKKFIQSAATRCKTNSNAFSDSVISYYNQRILNKFWAQKYEDKELVDIRSARYDFKRALKELGPVPLDSDLATIRKKLSSLPISKMKRIYARLNEIRGFLEIKEKLSTNKSEVQKISYITMPELNRLLKNTHDVDVKNAMGTLFATGLRLGELLALEPNDYVGGYLNVVKQVRKNGDVALPKRNKTGKVAVIEELVEYLIAFLNIEDKHKLRNKIQNTIVEVSNTVLKRHIHTHDLRHSHAIYLLGKGASLTLIALQLRNRIEVCQKYYSGFEHTDDTLKMLKAIANS